MAVTVETTPNPLARKFTVGVPVGGPTTYVEASEAPDGIEAILGLPGVRSVFATADFVTVSGNQDIDWDAITPSIIASLEGVFG